jgi:hypothetical protein
MSLPAQFTTGKILPLLAIAACVTALVLIAKTDDFKESKSRALRVFGKFGEYLLFAIAAGLFVPILFASVCVLGLLVSALPVWIVSLFSQHFADSLHHVLVPDWPSHLGLVIPAAIGSLSILCGSQISHALERKRVIEDEIKSVSGIQIIDPAPPGPVESLAARSSDAIDRLYKRCFWWIDDIGEKFERLSTTRSELPTVVRGLSYIVLGFMVGAITFWVSDVSFDRPWLKIPEAVGLGWIVIYVAIMSLGLVAVAVVIPFAVPVFAWQSAKHIVQWVARNLPRGLVIRYQQWKLRHGFVKRRSLDWLTALVAIALIIIAVAGLKACSTSGPSSDEDSEEMQSE